MNDQVHFFYRRLRQKSHDIDSPSYVGFASRAAQQVRFEQLLQIGVRDGDSVIDCGCGVGDLWIYLREHGRSQCSYVGLDISEEYVLAARQKYPGIRAVCEPIEHFDGCADWVLASGLFSVNATLESVVQTIDACQQRCRRGVAFNMLRRDELAQQRRAQIVDYILRPYQLSTFVPSEVCQALAGRRAHVELREGYLPDDFTVYVRPDTGTATPTDDASREADPAPFGAVSDPEIAGLRHQTGLHTYPMGCLAPHRQTGSNPWRDTGP